MIARALIALIRVYQRLISPFFGNVCRFEPSCSRYAVRCLETQGAWRGSLLSIGRLCKCHPFHPGGYDPPPDHTTAHVMPRVMPGALPPCSSAGGRLDPAYPPSDHA